MTLDSKKTTVHKNQKVCYDFLGAPENYEKLMPESIEKFELNQKKGFVFQLKGMPEISLQQQERQPLNKVVWGAVKDKFTFSLAVNIREVAPDKSEIQFIFDGEFNAMMAMMIKKTLQKFIQTLSDNLSIIEQR